MKIFRYRQLLAVLVPFLVSFSFAGEKRPDWVRERPVSQAYYIGIGVAQREEADRDYIQIAKDNALNDLASQIKIIIAGEVIRKVVEKSGLVEENFISHIRSSTKAELEGFELVDTWEDKNEYWVYYRLSKSVYERGKQLKLTKAISLSLDLFSNAKANEKANNIEKALLFYLQSLNPIEKYVNEPLETHFEGSRIFLMNEIYSSVQYLLSKIELRPIGSKRNAKIGQPLKNPLEVSAIYISENGSEIGISNLPLKFSFIRGSGELVNRVRTDRFGKGRCQVSKITATDKIQLVKVELDVFSCVNLDSASVILQSIISSLLIPKTRFALNVSGLSVFVEAEEIHYGQKLSVQHIEPALKNYLSEKGFVFFDDISKSDLIIKVKAESKKGSEIYEMYSAFVDLTISILDITSGDEIYKNSLHDIKGIDLDYNKAGLKAFENAAKKVNENIAPDLIQRIQK